MATAEVLDKVQALMREGKVDEADALISEHKAAVAAAPQPGDPPPPPRKQQDIFYELLNELVQHLGSPPALVALLKELSALEAKL